MAGPVPKPAGLRQRRNRVATRATLPTAAEAATNEVPPLPKRRGKWHVRVVEWWEAVWRSPMASEFLDADVKGGLYVVAELHQGFWKAKTAGDRRALATEIRQQEMRFGLSPIDRRRLQWEVEKAESAAERTHTRRQRQRGPGKSGQPKDPRDVLRLA